VRVAVAFDHRGVHLREAVLEFLRGDGHETVDLGTDTDAVRIDYPDKARELGEAITSGTAYDTRSSRPNRRTSPRS